VLCAAATVDPITRDSALVPPSAADGARIHADSKVSGMDSKVGAVKVAMGHEDVVGIFIVILFPSSCLLDDRRAIPLI
jgi:hypothetical protein